MATPAQLIDELDTEAYQFSALAIVVAFDEKTEFVFHDGESAEELRRLNDLIAAGGEPIGLLGYQITDAGSRIATLLYDEYEKVPWAANLMNGAAKLVDDKLKAR